MYFGGVRTGRSPRLSMDSGDLDGIARWCVLCSMMVNMEQCEYMSFVLSSHQPRQPGMAKITTIHASKMWPKDVCKKICYKDWSSPGYPGRSAKGRWFDICNIIVAYSCYICHIFTLVSHGLVDFQAFLVIVRSFLARGCGLWVVGPSSTRCGTPLCGTMEPCQALATCESSLCSAYGRLTNWIVFLYHSFVCVCDSKGKSFDMMCKWMCVYLFVLWQYYMHVSWYYQCLRINCCICLDF